MKILYTLILFLSLACGYFAQEEILLIDNFRIKVESGSLVVSGINNDQLIYQKKFISPSLLAQDMDNDGTKELLITDCDQKQNICYYTVYLYNTADSFFVIDSIYAGLKQPYTFTSEEINDEILITGSPDFDSLYSPVLGVSFSPIICWQYNGSELEIVNDKLYDVFITENEGMLDYIDVYLKENGRNCSSVTRLKQAIASVYANYISADEKTNAEYTLNRYYSCDDLDKFKALLKELQ